MNVSPAYSFSSPRQSLFPIKDDSSSTPSSISMCFDTTLVLLSTGLSLSEGSSLFQKSSFVITSIHSLTMLGLLLSISNFHRRPISSIRNSPFYLMRPTEVRLDISSHLAQPSPERICCKRPSPDLQCGAWGTQHGSSFRTIGHDRSSNICPCIVFLSCQGICYFHRFSQDPVSPTPKSLSFHFPSFNWNFRALPWFCPSPTACKS